MDIWISGCLGKTAGDIPRKGGVFDKFWLDGMRNEFDTSVI